MKTARMTFIMVIFASVCFGGFMVKGGTAEVKAAAGTEVHVDGVAMGKTPGVEDGLDLAGLTAGKHNLILYGNNAKLEFEISIVPGKHVVVFADMSNLEPHCEKIVTGDLPKAYDGGNLYYWYYATCALRQMESESWPKWNKALRDILVNAQARQGCATGSWAPTSNFTCQRGGRMFTTIFACLCLEGYYRYMPVRWGA